MTRYLLLFCTVAALLQACTPQTDERPAAEAEPTAGTQRIVTLGGAITELTFALGSGGSIVGTDLSSIYPAAETARLPKVGYWRTLSAEGVLSLHPTLVLADHDAGPASVLQQIRDAGVQVHHLPLVLSPEQAQERIHTMASLLGREERGKELASELERETRQVQEYLRSVPGEVPTLFIYIRGMKVFQVAGTNTAGDAMIRLAGGMNAGSALDGWKPVDTEFFLGARPKVLIVTTTGLESIGGLENLKTLPGLQATPAVQNGHVLVVDDLAFLGFGPRLPQTLRQMADMYATVGGQTGISKKNNE